MKLVFDIGMYDGADSRYFLDEGFRVVAVEANPVLIAHARVRFAGEIASNQLILIDAAIAKASGEVDLAICSEDPGSSSLFPAQIAHRGIARTHTVRATTFDELLREYGTPHYLKVDIEGADRYCVLALDALHRPDFLSFEVNEDLEELIAHLTEVGYARFKLIGQCSFLEIDNEHGLRERSRQRILHLLGVREPKLVRRAGRWFELMHSSGPAPWCSDGPWYPAPKKKKKWRRAKLQGSLRGWYDVHAC